jgi:4-amino-4-deoxy-L-arabinose transferase-like glycosyltransferase
MRHALDHVPSASPFARWRSAGVGLVVLCVLVLWPGLAAIPPVDRDESRFAQASRQMVESGDWIIPRVQERPRLNKPPAIYWMQSASVKVFGDEPGDRLANMWVYRLPSAVCAVLTVLAVWRLGLRMIDPRAATLAAALLAVCPMLVWDAHQARADQALLLSVVLAQRALWEILAAWSRGGRAGIGWVLGLWACLGAGVLIKGPITPLVCGLTLAGWCVLHRSVGPLWAVRPVLGLAVLLLVAAPWAVLVAQRVGLERYASIVFEETLGRSAEPAEGHWGPPGYHLVALCVLFWPGVLLTAAAVRRAVEVGVVRRAAGGGGKAGRWWSRRVGRRAEAFALCWALPAWVVFELISTKLPHYTLVLYPALALLSARCVLGADAERATGGARLAHARTASARAGFVVWGVVGVLGLAGLTWTVLVPGLRGWGPAPSTWTLVWAGVATMLVLVGVPLATWWALRDRFVRATLLAIGLTAAWGGVFLHGVVPGAGAVFPSVPIAELLRQAGADDPGAGVGTVGYHEDSLIFLTRGRARRLDPEDVRGFVSRHRTAALAVQEGSEAEIDPRAMEGLEWIGRVDGFNYSTGRRVRVDVYAKGVR